MNRSDEIEALYVAHRGEIYAYLVGLGLEPAVAQELTQEVYVRLIEELDGRSVRNHRAWLFRAAHNLAIDEHRSRSRASELPTAEYDHPKSPEDPEQLAMQRQKERTLMLAIRQLSPQQLACLQLRSNGLRYREIAEVLGISVPTVGEFLQRAIKNMRKLLYG